MARNITLKLDEAVLQECKKRAFEEDKSVSQWVSDMIIKNVSQKASFESSRRYALTKLGAFRLGGEKISRDDLHERD